MDELAMSLVWSRVGFYGCAVALMFGAWGMFFTQGKASDQGMFLAFFAFVGMCFFGMHY